MASLTCPVPKVAGPSSRKPALLYMGLPLTLANKTTGRLSVDAIRFTYSTKADPMPRRWEAGATDRWSTSQYSLISASGPLVPLAVLLQYSSHFACEIDLSELVYQMKSSSRRRSRTSNAMKVNRLLAFLKTAETYPSKKTLAEYSVPCAYSSLWRGSLLPFQSRSIPHRPHRSQRLV